MHWRDSESLNVPVVRGILQGLDKHCFVGPSKKRDSICKTDHSEKYLTAQALKVQIGLHVGEAQDVGQPS